MERRLRYAANVRRRFDAERVQHGGNHVDGMTELRAYFALRFDALRPAHDEGIRHAATIRFALPAPERRIASVRPAPRIVIEVFRSADVVDGRQVLLEVIGHVVEEL